MPATTKPLTWAAMLCFTWLEVSHAFVPSLVGRERLRHSNINSPHHPGADRLILTSRRRLKRPRPRTQTAAAAEEAGEWEGSLMELDVVEYQKGGEDGSMELGSYIGDGKLQPLLTRKESGPNLFFHDEDAQPVAVSGGSCRIVRVLDEVYFSQRIIEDRVKNPHGEEAEDCFLLEGSLNPATVIRVEHSRNED